jgi:hypothetical protein
MFEEEAVRYVEDLFTKPLFRKWFNEFFVNMQREGVEAAKKYWNVSHGGDLLIPTAPELFEKLSDFYIVLGFVPRTKYDEVLRENENLKYVNTFLTEVIKQLRLNIFAEGGEEIRKSWEEVIDKQMEMNKEIAKTCFGLFRQLAGSGR